MGEKEKILSQLAEFKAKGYDMKQIKDRVQKNVREEKNINKNEIARNEIHEKDEEIEKFGPSDMEIITPNKDEKNVVDTRNKNEVIVRPVNELQNVNKKDTITHINFNAKEGKYEYYKIDSDKKVVEERTVEAKKISFFEMRRIRKHLKEKCSEYAENMGLEKDAFNDVVKLIDPNVFNLLDDDEKLDYVNSLDTLKDWKSIRKTKEGKQDSWIYNNEFLGAINYDMRGFKNLKSMRFFEKRRLNKIAKKQNKINFATYQSDKRKDKRLIAALMATGIAAGGTMIGKDSDVRQPLENKNPTPKQEKQINNKENNKEDKENEVNVKVGDSATLENGTYYYDSNKSEPKGEIKDLQNKDVKIKYVAVKNNDGTTKVYNEKDDVNIADLQKNAPDSEIFVSVGNVEKEGMTNYDDLGWMDYKDVSQAFEKVEKDEILADNKDTKTVDLSDGKSKMEIGKNGNVKVVIPQSINDTVEQIKGTNEQNSSRKDFQEQLRKGVNSNSKLSDFTIQDNQQQQQKTQNQKTQDDDGSRQ